MAEKESWEHIAPELPPGAYRYGDAFEWGACRSASPAGLWRHFRHYTGITRKRYAELIAVERVRGVAGEKWGVCVISVSMFTDGEDFSLSVWAPKGSPNALDGKLVDAEGPTLCDAAWACIQALGGGE